MAVGESAVEYAPLEEPKLDRPRASLAAVTVNLVTAGLGAGILSLPWAMAGASVIPSVATIVAVMLFNGVTVMILVVAAERWRAFDLGGLLSHLPGRWGKCMQYVCNSFTLVSVYLCLVSYIVVIADSLEPFALVASSHRAGDSEERARLRPPLLALGALGVLPLCFLDQQHLSFSSTLGIMVNLYLLVLVFVLHMERGTAPDCCAFGVDGTGTITMFSTMMQCAIIQMCVLPMYEEMDKRSPRRFSIAVLVGFGFLTVLFSAFTTVAYLTFGPRVQANVIDDFPGGSLGKFARLALVVAVAATYPLIAVSVTAPVRHWESYRHLSGHRAWTVVTVFVVAASAVGALFFEKLGPLNELNGALQVLCFIGLVPGVTGLFLLGYSSPLWKLGMFTLVVGSVATSFAGLRDSHTNPAALERLCTWHVIADE